MEISKRGTVTESCRREGGGSSVVLPGKAGKGFLGGETVREKTGKAGRMYVAGNLEREKGRKAVRQKPPDRCVQPDKSGADKASTTNAIAIISLLLLLHAKYIYIYIYTGSANRFTRSQR